MGPRVRAATEKPCSESRASADCQPMDALPNPAPVLEPLPGSLEHLTITVQVLVAPEAVWTADCPRGCWVLGQVVLPYTKGDKV